MNTPTDQTTSRPTSAEIELLQTRLLDSKPLLDAFPGPLPAPCLLRRVLDTGGGDVEALPLLGVVVIGRQSDPPFGFPDDGSLSGRHFRILVGPRGRCYAEDLNSTNGLWVNGRRVKQRLLVHGDAIHAGNQDWVFHDGGPLDPEDIAE
ncbi:MAG: FHA domain-containing protein [Verrucomicrobiales bacterium]|nr:FHA domain-containing protein [Verrucomicrobiales bacterium]